MIWFSIFVLVNVVAWVFILSSKYPFILAVIVIFLTPLLSGMTRGAIIPYLKPNEAVLVGIFFMYLLGLIFFNHATSNSSKLFSFIDIGFFILFLGTGLIPLIKTLYTSNGISFNDIFPYLSTVQYFLLYKIVTGTVRSKKDLRMVLYAFIISGMIVSFLAILEGFHVKFVENLLWRFYPSVHLTDTLTNTRVASILGNWAAMAAFSIIQILFSLIMLSRCRGFIKSWVLYLCVALSALAFVPTVSMAGAVGLFIGGLYFLFDKSLRKYVILAAFLIGVGVWIFLPFVQNRLNIQFSGLNGGYVSLLPSTFVHRIMLWSSIYLPVIRQNLIWGYGPNIPFEIGGGITTTQESEYIGLLFTSGIVGLIAHLSYVAIVFSGLLRIYKTKGNFNRIFSEFSMVLLVILSIMGISNSYFSYSGVAESLWLFCSLSVCVYFQPFQNIEINPDARGNLMQSSIGSNG